MDEPSRSATTNESAESSLLDRLKRRFIYGLAFGLVVVVALTLLGDGPALLRTLGNFDWTLTPLIILLTLSNYVLRFGKWHLYLRWLNIKGVHFRTSLGIFLAGLSMAMTPGKVGEFLKSYLLRRATRTPISVSAPIVVAERATDGIAMLGLAALGLGTTRYGWPVLALMSVVALGTILLLQRRSLMYAIFARLERITLLSRRMHALHLLYESTYALFRPGKLVTAVGIGFVSWWGECLAFFLILVGLGLEPTFTLLITATFILATASLLGSISMLPGGLGAAEASVAGLLLLVITDPQMTPDLAAAATLLVRFATLWFGVLVGLVALLGIERHLERLEDTTTTLDATQAAD